MFGSVNLLRVEDFTRSGRRLVSDLKKIATRGTPLNDVLRFILAKPGREKPSYRQRLIMEREINRFVPRSKELARNNPSTRFIKSLGETGLESLFDEGSFGYKLVRTPLNPFTLPNSNEVKRLTQSNLNSDIVPLKRAARLSSTFVEHQRRLYRFSLFHRAILKNSHKITNAKRLITSGFYDSSLTANNL